jgi:peptide/nickel transport system substrate-binding protein
MFRTKFIRITASLACAVALVIALAGNAYASAAKPHRGGTLTVTESSDAATWPVGLDPATNTSDLGDAPQMSAIYGQLFADGPGGTLVPRLATGYNFSNGTSTVTIYLRHGVVFQDGTPFDAQAVAYNIGRDLEPKYACICDSSFPVTSITTPNNYTVVLNLSKPFSPLPYEFPGSAPDWIASPTALRKEGELDFAKDPVGAGPFEVVSDVYNVQLVLKRYPGYWEKGHPYLNQLIFKSVGNDTSSYDAVLAGDAQVAENLMTPSIEVAAKKQSSLDVDLAEGRAAVGGIQFNTTVSPFNNQLAREAVYYATNPAPINKGLAYGTGTVIQSPSLPGSPFYEQKVPGYRSYNLAKAKALVKQLGGLSFSFDYTGASGNEAAALQAQWQAADMHVNLVDLPTLEPLLEAYKSNKWESVLQGAGGLNPAIGTGSSYWRYYSTGPFTGTHDAHLDHLVDEAAATPNVAAQVKIYKEVYSYLSEKAYLVFLYSSQPFNVSKKTIHGPGISTPLIFPSWPDVWIS